MTNLVPWREPAWALLHERLAQLAEWCDAGGRAGEPGAEAVREAGERAAQLATRVGSHVPAELRARGAVS